MNTALPAPLVFFHILADRDGKPNGLLFDADGAEGDALQALFDEEGFAGLSTSMDCYFRETTAPELAAALTALHWKQMVPGTLFRSDDQLVGTFLPPTATHVDGNWCMAPPPKAVGPQAASRALALQLVQLVAADADTHEIEALLRHDPTLSYHLLKLVNSLGMGSSRKITSFSQAILILGRAQLRRWLNLMLFAARQGDPRSAMLLARVAVRARALELLAKARGLDKSAQEQAFMTGMFSLLGTLFGMDLPDVLKPLAIADAVAGALLRHEGELGHLLVLIEHAERGELPVVARQLAALQIDCADFNNAMVDATTWMMGTVRESQGTANG
ncbi:MAG: HDOD domain-containing protein [Pseudomonadota bacterium]